jgi:uncharacterized protein involved in type VI secretion and phage assembly
MSDLADYIQHEIARALASQPGIKAAEVSAYDPKRHAIKAMLKPDGIETGWFPMHTSHVGNGFGVTMGPNIGDQIVVGFLGHNMNNPVHLGRLHSDKEQPPTVNAGEMLMKDQNGNSIKFTASGIAINGNVDFSNGYVKSNGHAIDDSHQHKDTAPGAGLSGVPQ